MHAITIVPLLLALFIFANTNNVLGLNISSVYSKVPGFMGAFPVNGTELEQLDSSGILKSKGRMSQSVMSQYVDDAIPAYFRITQRCSDIRFYLDILIIRIRLGGTVKQIEEMVSNICVTLGMTKPVCKGIAERFVPTFHYIVGQRPQLTSDACTGIIFQQLGCTTKDRYIEWNIDDPNDCMSNTTFESNESNMPSKMPTEKVAQSKMAPASPFWKKVPSILKTIDSVLLDTSGPQRPLKILHLTDIHVDPLYKIESNANCENRLLCCHETDGKPENRSVTAGKYGSSRSCDLPLWTFEIALENIRKTHPDLDLIYISGDFVPHNMWYTTKSDNIKLVEYVSRTIRRYFPDIQIVPILGNHEPHPVNMFSPANAPSDLSTSWVFPATQNSWINWIPPDAATSYVRNHYYSIDIQNKFRVLVINTNLCFGFNFWQLFSFNDFKSQLRWLRSELQKSMESQQPVHILGHVPPGHIQCSTIFSRNYYNLIAKYRAVVKAQFFGHTHVDTFRLNYNKEGEPINPQWVSPSLTPFRSNNPGYKVYYLDPTSSEVTDHETYILDLEKANAGASKPTFTKLYTATEVYHVPDVRISNLALIIDKMAKNETLFHEYYRLHRKGVNSQQSQPCRTYCRKRSLCRIVQPYFGDLTECNRVQKKVDGTIVPMYYNDPL